MLRRTLLLFTLILLLVILPAGGTSRAASGEAAAGKTPAYAPGQVLVRFKSDTSLKTAETLVAPHRATPMHQIADRTFTLAVSEGQEEKTVEALLGNPAVQHASLNYRMVEAPVGSLKPAPEETLPERNAGLTQEPESCITDLWMSTSQQGDRIPDNLVSSGTPLVYAFFEYEDCDLEALRLQMFYLKPAAALESVFDEQGLIISGSGVQGIQVQAWPHFAEGGFPVGSYLTIVSLSPTGGWDTVKDVGWRVSTFPNDYWFVGTSNYQWPLHSTGRLALPEADIDMPQAWDTTTGGSDILIAVVSTGVKMNHPDLTDMIWTNPNEIPANGVDDDENGCVDDVHGCEFFNGEGTPDPTDSYNWGTFAAGIAAAETNNGEGIAGVSWGARIMPIKVLRLFPNGVLGGYLADTVMAIDYAVSNGARIIHVGPRVKDETSEEKLALLESTIDEAVSQGALVVAGSGDTGEMSLAYPARFENVVAVGAISLSNERTWFSNGGAGLDVVAPGEVILSTCVPAPYCTSGTTLAAAAHVEGVASLIWSVNPELTPAQVRNILRETASDLGPPGYDEEYGYGKVNAAEAVAQTPHHLYLHTANLDDPHSSVFLLDDTVSRTCQRVWNPWTGSQTWVIESANDWLTIENPRGTESAPVPSDYRICADASLLPEPGTYEATLKAQSTMTRHENPIEIPVTAIYTNQLTRLRLGFIQRP